MHNLLIYNKIKNIFNKERFLFLSRTFFLLPFFSFLVNIGVNLVISASLCVNTRLIYFNLSARYLAMMTKFNSRCWMNSLFFFYLFFFSLRIFLSYAFNLVWLFTMAVVTDKSESGRARQLPWVSTQTWAHRHFHLSCDYISPSVVNYTLYVHVDRGPSVTLYLDVMIIAFNCMLDV